MNESRKYIDIVIPFHNEYLNLKILLPKLYKVIKKIKQIKFRIIFINDGSSDNGQIFIKKFIKKNKNSYLLNNKKRFGQTYSYTKYLKNFKSEYFIRMDADNQDNPIHIIKFAKLILMGYDLILTERKLRKHSIYMILLTFFYNKLISLLVKKKLSNYSSSLAGFRRKYISSLNFRNNDHRYLPIISIENGAKKIKLFSVLHQKRVFGYTKYGMLKKVILALPEFLYFFYRLKMGLYKI
tara:strand:+ start:180 stop:896 length:717 start_codon:yes stop_codon:yes gene_type:complete